MILSKASSGVAFENSAACRGVSLGSLNGHIDLAVIEVNGRYPDSGYLVNTICKEAVYVLEGSGTLSGPDASLEFSAGDAVYVDSNEKFAWEGSFKAVFSLTPAFDPAQHEQVSA